VADSLIVTHMSYILNTLESLCADTDFCKLQNLIFEVNKSKGFHDKPRSVGDCLALIHSELSEVLEEHRNGRGLTEVYYKRDANGLLKPEGIPIELADVIIRVLDVASEFGIYDLLPWIIVKERYNILRPHMHGKIM
jgi:hypothetical protein